MKRLIQTFYSGECRICCPPDREVEIDEKPDRNQADADPTYKLYYDEYDT